MTQIKICGMTNQEDALFAASSGVDALGFIFYEKTPRFVTPEKAKGIIAALPGEVARIGVFVNHSYDEIERIRTFCNLDMIQLHGDESPEFCRRFPSSMVVRSFALRTEDDLRLLDDYPGTPILADSYAPGLRGGTGRIVDWNLARRVMKTHPLILSGGLSPDNISEALAAVSPDAVDINSGVETAPGKKDPEKIRAIVDLIRRSEGTAVANGERIFRLSARL